jgi:hypothetical protein
MADTKISALTASTTPLAGTEVLPIVQGGVTKQVSVANLTAGRAVSAASVTASTGNFVVGTSGQGIDFSATPGTGTSELFADYEEGDWTPTYSSGYSSVGYDDRLARYLKIGKQVTVWGRIDTSGASSANATQIIISGLPFTSSNAATAAPGGGFITQAKNIVVLVNIPVLRIPKNSATIQFWTLDDVSFDGTNLNSSDNIFAFVATYEAA